MAGASRRGYGEDGIYFDHRDDCRDSAHHKTCSGRWRGVVSLGYVADGKRIRRKVSGQTRTEVKDKLKQLHSELDAGVRTVQGYTVEAAVADWLVEGLPGRATKTVEVYADAHVLHGQIPQRDPPDNREQRTQRAGEDLDRFGGAARQAFNQPVGHGGLDRVPLDGPDARVELGVQLLELVFDLGPGLAADLPADPLPVRDITERDHPAPPARTGLVVSAVPAVVPMVEVDAIFAVATA